MWEHWAGSVLICLCCRASAVCSCSRDRLYDTQRKKESTAADHMKTERWKDPAKVSCQCQMTIVITQTVWYLGASATTGSAWNEQLSSFSSNTWTINVDARSNYSMLVKILCIFSQGMSLHVVYTGYSEYSIVTVCREFWIRYGTIYLSCWAQNLKSKSANLSQYNKILNYQPNLNVIISEIFQPPRWVTDLLIKNLI